MMRAFATLGLILLSSGALAQERRTVDQVVAIEIGQCVIARASLAVEIEALKARVAQLERDLAAAKPAEAPPSK